MWLVSVALGYNVIVLFICAGKTIMLVENERILWPISTSFIYESVACFHYTEGCHTLIVYWVDMFQNPQGNVMALSTNDTATVYRAVYVL